MGNSVSAHIYETKVFRPYPVILYRPDYPMHWWKKIGRSEGRPNLALR